jgi:tetratricopeptide (TPR) repeat protein
MSQVEARPQELLQPEADARGMLPPEEQKQQEEEPFSIEEPAPPKPDLSQARLLATEPRPAGFGDVLVTDVWSRPAPKERKEEAPPADRWQGQGSVPASASGERSRSAPPGPPDRQRDWEARQELRELGLLRERPMVSYDARFESYWKQVKEAIQGAPDAIVDPYTQLAAEFADVELERLAEHRAERGEYGHEGDALLALARGYWAIGRHKGARGALEAAAKAEPQHPSVWYNLGVVRLFGRANKAAREALEEGVDQAPGDFRSELALAVACYHLRDYAAAEEQFRRLAGSSGMRATARSMLACSLRMQSKWDDARAELSFLKGGKPGDWGAMSQQCLDCVERGEQKLVGALRARRRSGQMWRALAATAAGGVWLAYGMAQHLFKREAQWAVIPLFLLVLLVARSLKRISGRELPGEFGNAEQGLICWQSTSWMRPRQSGF